MTEQAGKRNTLPQGRAKVKRKAKPGTSRAIFHCNLQDRNRVAAWRRAEAANRRVVFVVVFVLVVVSVVFLVVVGSSWRSGVGNPSHSAGSSLTVLWSLWWFYREYPPTGPKHPVEPILERLWLVIVTLIICSCCYPACSPLWASHSSLLWSPNRLFRCLLFLLLFRVVGQQRWTTRRDCCVVYCWFLLVPIFVDNLLISISLDLCWFLLVVIIPCYFWLMRFWLFIIHCYGWWLLWFLVLVA